MTGLLAKLTVTPLLWACGLLLVVVAVLGVQLKLKAGALDVATADVARVATERDAWKGAASRSLAANQTLQGAFERVHTLLEQEQGERRRLDTEGRAALQRAQQAAADADRTLATWMARYSNQVRIGDCAAALNAVQRACPMLEGY